jgi:ATP-binding cassette subfamily B protein
VGTTGSGKSTVARLLLRFADPTAGAVLIDGVPLASVAQASLRGPVLGYVPQDISLFNETLRYNLVYARPGASEADVGAAVEAAQLAAFVARLPEGLETRVGERGLKLSGGEKQRVALARALLADPPVLVLDEATSALDSTTEAAVQAAIASRRAGRTTFVVAHRLSTIRDADEIIVLEAGRVAERGAHAQLLAQGGRYAELWARQREGDADAPAAPALPADAGGGGGAPSSEA